MVDSAPHTGVGRLWSAFTTVRERTTTDGDLLDRFVRDGDELAFGELVRRLGPTVYGVCRRLLGDTADADDAFQATFFVLSRKAASVNPPGKVAAWVYGVASLSARKLRYTRLRRRQRERPVHPLPDTPTPEKEMDATLLPAVDDELGRLPDHFRLPIVLCGVRGLTVVQAAAELGLPVGTLASRLSRGRAELTKRLAKRGIALGVLTTAGGWGELAAAVPPRLLEQTVAAVTGGTLPPAVAALSSEVSTAMTWTPIRRLTAGLLCASGLALAGGGMLIPQGNAAPVPAASVPGESKTLDRVNLQQVGGLLRQESVRKEIGLSDDEYKKLSDFRDGQMSAVQKRIENDVQAQFQAQGGGGGVGPVPNIDTTQYLKWTDEAEAEFAKKVCETLKPAGVKRLKQAVIQSAGPRALLDRLAIRELLLTAEQEDKLDALLSPNRHIDFSTAQVPKLAATRDSEHAAALKVLTADQRKRWDAMVGKAFPTADLLKAHPMSEETMNEQMKWVDVGVGGGFGPALPVPGGVVPAVPVVPPPAQEKKEEKKEGEKKE